MRIVSILWIGLLKILPISGKDLNIFSELFFLYLIFLRIEFFNLFSKSSVSSINSLFTGTLFSAAAVGVGALKSETKSIKVLSVSWPIAEITGILDLKTDLTTFSSLNPHKSSILPPPLATIIKSGFGIPLCSKR